MMNLRQARADRALIQSAIGYQFDICVMELTETRRYTNVGLYAQDGEHRFYSVSAASPTRWSQGTVVVIEMTGEPARTALQDFYTIPADPRIVDGFRVPTHEYVDPETHCRVHGHDPYVPPESR